MRILNLLNRFDKKPTEKNRRCRVVRKCKCFSFYNFDDGFEHTGARDERKKGRFRGEGGGAVEPGTPLPPKNGRDQNGPGPMRPRSRHRITSFGFGVLQVHGGAAGEGVRRAPGRDRRRAAVPGDGRPAAAAAAAADRGRIPDRAQRPEAVHAQHRHSRSARRRHGFGGRTPSTVRRRRLNAHVLDRISSVCRGVFGGARKLLATRGRVDRPF